MNPTIPLQLIRRCSVEPLLAESCGRLYSLTLPVAGGLQRSSVYARFADDTTLEYANLAVSVQHASKVVAS